MDSFLTDGGPGECAGTGTGVLTVVQLASRYAICHGTRGKTGIKWRHEGRKIPQIHGADRALGLGYVGHCDGGVSARGAKLGGPGKVRHEHRGNDAQKELEDVWGGEESNCALAARDATGACGAGGAHGAHQAGFCGLDRAATDGAAAGLAAYTGGLWGGRELRPQP